MEGLWDREGCRHGLGRGLARNKKAISEQSLQGFCLIADMHSN